MQVYKIGGIVVGIAFVIGLVVAILVATPDSKKPVEKDVIVTILHFNDFHGRFEPITSGGGSCQPGDNELGLCFGGIARLYTAVREKRNIYENPIVLNGGDNYQGTLLYSLFKWNITLEMMRQFNFDAVAFGNHEFDDKLAGLVPFVDGLGAPMVAANMDASNEPTLDGKFQKSTIIYRDEVKIGIVGCITKETPSISSPENVIFTDEIESVKAEVKRLKDDGTKIIILLSHSGYDVDLVLAQEIPDIDVIVGSHSHTFLYTGEPPSSDVPEGEYPTVVTHNNDQKTLIVQAMAFSKYLGFLQVKFDKSGNLVSWSGNPVLLDSSTPEDPSILAQLQPWTEAAADIGAKPLGTSAVYLDMSTCYDKECNLGNFLTDAMVFEHVELVDDEGWAEVGIAIMNPGGIRAPMGDSTNITYNDLITAQPFQNTIDTIEMQGKDIAELMELAASPPTYRKYAKNFDNGAGCFQVSGLKAIYDFSMPDGYKLVDLTVKCSRCVMPKYEHVDPEAWYKIAMQSFLTSGNQFPIIAERGRNKTVGRIDTEVFASYLSKKSPIVAGVENRIKVFG